MDEFLNKVTCVDALEGLKRLPDECVDLVITDPPYNISQPKKIDRTRIENRKVGGSRRAKPLNYDFGDWDKFPSLGAYLSWTKEWLKEVVRVMKPTATIYCFFPESEVSFLGYMMKELGLHVRQTCVWHKTNPVPQLFKVGYMSAAEFFVFATKNKGAGHTFNYHLGQQHCVFTYPICQGKERTEHPTQKPLKLIEKLLLYSSNEGDLVLDPFAGSGTTGVAALKHGRRFIGFDVEPKYCQIANERMRTFLQTERIKDYL